MESKIRIVRRLKGVRFRRMLWIDKDSKEVWPIEGMTIGHLFFAMRMLEKWASTDRWKDVQKLRDEIGRGRDKQGMPITRQAHEKAIKSLETLSDRSYAEARFPIWTDMKLELISRGVDPFSDRTAQTARLQYEEDQRAKGRMVRDQF